MSHKQLTHILLAVHGQQL